MKTYILPCSKKCGELVERKHKMRPAVCFDCKSKRKKKNTAKHLSPLREFHSKHIEVDRILVYSGNKAYIKKTGALSLIKRATKKWHL
jgi:hypothetical protein